MSGDVRNVASRAAFVGADWHRLKSRRAGAAA
jgi:hypothetical protein